MQLNFRPKYEGNIEVYMYNRHWHFHSTSNYRASHAKYITKYRRVWFNAGHYLGRVQLAHFLLIMILNGPWHERNGGLSERCPAHSRPICLSDLWHWETAACLTAMCSRVGKCSNAMHWTSTDQQQQQWTQGSLVTARKLTCLPVHVYNTVKNTPDFERGQ